MYSDTVLVVFVGYVSRKVLSSQEVILFISDVRPILLSSVINLVGQEVTDLSLLSKQCVGL